MLLKLFYHKHSGQMLRKLNYKHVALITKIKNNNNNNK